MKNKKSLLYVFKARDLDEAITKVKDLEHATITVPDGEVADMECPGGFPSTLFTKKKLKDAFIFYDFASDDYLHLYQKDKDTGNYFYDLANIKDVIDLNSLPDYILVNEDAESVAAFVNSRRLFEDYNTVNKHDNSNRQLLLEVIRTTYNKYYVAMFETTKLEKEVK